MFPVPKEIKYLFPKTLNKTKPFVKLKLVTPYQGIARKCTKTPTNSLCHL
jgi:hypothetical protein